MKRILIILGIIGGVLVAAAVLIMLQMRSGSPEMLLAKLAKGRGDKEELIMRLNMARGDVVPPMIAAFQNNSHPSKFRAEVLELLAKKNLRTNKSEIEQVLMKALKDSDVVIRRKAAYCAAVYGPDHLRLVLVENVEDPDVHIRQNIYQLLCGSGWRSRGAETRDELSPEQKNSIVQSCRRRMNTEETEEMRLLARSVVGREIDDCEKKAKQALL